MIVGSILLRFIDTAGLLGTTMLPFALRDDDGDPHGVLVTVDILPVECLTACVGSLAETGNDGVAVGAAIACALIAAGILMLLRLLHTRQTALPESRA